MIVYLDFDGTVVEHNYPYIGEYNEGCFEVVKKLQNAEHEIILNTYRADINDGTLEKAIEYLNTHSNLGKINSILKYTINKIIPPPYNLESYNNSKIIFIDDISAGVPLKNTIILKNSYMIDWKKINEEFEKNGFYEKMV